MLYNTIHYTTATLKTTCFCNRYSRLAIVIIYYDRTLNYICHLRITRVVHLKLFDKNETFASPRSINILLRRGEEKSI